MLNYIFSLNILLFFVLSFYSIILKNKSITTLIIILMLIIISCFYGFRDIIIYNSEGYTVDTYRYALLWFPEIQTINDIFYGSSSWKKAYVFFFIPYFVNYFSSSPNVYLFVNSLVSFGLLFYGYYKIINGKKNYYLFPFIIFLIFVTSTVVANYGNLLRQGLAISFVLISIYYMLIYKYIFGYMFLILALFSHFSVIMFFIIYFFVFHRDIKLKKYFFVLFLSLPFIVFDISSVFSFISSSGFLGDKLNAYEGSSSRMLVYKVILLFSMAVFLYLFFKNRTKSYTFDKIFKIYLSLLIISLLFFKVEIISGRLLYYAGILEPYFIFYFIFYIKQKDLYFFIVAIFTILYGFFILLASSTYKTIHFTNTLL